MPVTRGDVDGDENHDDDDDDDNNNNNNNNHRKLMMMMMTTKKNKTKMKLALWMMTMLMITATVSTIRDDAQIKAFTATGFHNYGILGIAAASCGVLAIQPTDGH